MVRRVVLVVCLVCTFLFVWVAVWPVCSRSLCLCFLLSPVWVLLLDVCNCIAVQVPQGREDSSRLKLRNCEWPV